MEQSPDYVRGKTTPEPQDDPLLAFYEASGRDAEGRTLEEILNWDDGRMEACHDYIQWLFPNEVPSAVNLDAPLVTARHVAAFAGRPDLRETLLRAFRRMLAFYGMELSTVAGKPHVGRAAHWDARHPTWLTPGNHNHLRLTRILTCLNLLGLPDHAAALFEFLDELTHAEGRAAVSQTTHDYWQSAARRATGSHGHR
jgi:hypothetical protein